MSELCACYDFCENFQNDYENNKNRIYIDNMLFCKNCNIEDIDGVKGCKNFKCKYDDYINKTQEERTNKDNYNIVNNPAHYTAGRKFEPAFVINDWGVNWYVGTCIKYLSRLGRKDASDQDISKALWYIIAEIAMNHKDIPKEKVIETINTIYERKEKYEQLKKE